MPIYEYRCRECGYISEFIVFGEHDSIYCKSCNSQNLEKILSAHNTLNHNRTINRDETVGCCGTPDSCGSPGTCCGG